MPKPSEDIFSQYLSLVVFYGLYSNQGKLKFYLKQIFDGIEINKTTLLDVGGGDGLFSFYAAIMGAKKVICLEPECEGSSEGTREKFLKLRTDLGLDNVKLIPETIQEYDSHGEVFDIILMHNSINHFNEEACINLITDPSAKNLYLDIISKLYDLTACEGDTIICDCSNKNFYDFLGMKNIFIPSIEWYKHQPPEAWVSLFEEAGFTDPEIRWTTLYPLRGFGKLFANKYAAYFLTSHFCIRMKK